MQLRPAGLIPEGSGEDSTLANISYTHVLARHSHILLHFYGLTLVSAAEVELPRDVNK